MSETYSYLSSKAAADPVKTLILLAPDSFASSYSSAEEFARFSGWQEQAERDAALLLVPVVEDGWQACSSDLPKLVYQNSCRAHHVAQGAGIPGGGDVAWAWETLIYVVGYQEGATFASSFLAAHPGFAAATLLVDGAPVDDCAWDAPSEHWLVSDPVDYACLNREVPVAVWLMGDASRALGLIDRLKEVNGATRVEADVVSGVETQIVDNPDHAGPRIFLSAQLTGFDPEIAEVAMSGLFNQVIRWKNAPDGTLSPHISKTDFFQGDTYEHVTVDVDGEPHHYALYIPSGVSREDAKGFPLVLSVHGRGEPSWIFAQKNGWEDLADETQAFVVMLPDSRGNIWSVERDMEAFNVMVLDALSRYELDSERVYLTGFSNGALFTCQMATTCPQLFAAASPWNSPGEVAIRMGGLGDYIYCPAFEKRGYEMPFWVVYGDADVKAPLMHEDGFEQILACNGCAASTQTWDGAEAYAPDAGYVAGSRMATDVFTDVQGRVMAGFTVMKNMPHGAIADEARACWEFMKRFRRPKGGARVEEMR